jgi:phosphoribosylformylglycinamidine (FGAM) synthase-like enzyme
VPTVGGEVVFESCYQSNPLVNVLRWAWRNMAISLRAPAVPVSDYVGAKTGRDGIHGASLLARRNFPAPTASRSGPTSRWRPALEKPLLEARPEVHFAQCSHPGHGRGHLTCSVPQWFARRRGAEIEWIWSCNARMA